MNYAFFILLSIVTLYPFWYTLVGSLVPFEEFADQALLLLPRYVTFQAYEQIFETSTIPNAYGITAFSTIVGTALNLLFTSIGAYVLSRRNLPGKMIFFTAILFTMLFSGGLIPIYLTLHSYGLINNVWVYILPSLINTFYLIIMKTSFHSIPDSLEEAAEIDGCSHFGILFRIFLPLSLPVLATLGLFYAVDRWNELFTALFFITDTDKYTLQAVLYNMLTSVDTTTQNVITTDRENMATEQVKLATIIVAIVPILLVYPFLQRFFIKGVLIGSVKG
ncbi:ABC transporter permease [Paenibacillus sp. 598K]|nr:ABC transporter permease [Paenibacillus sp. 598K]